MLRVYSIFLILFLASCSGNEEVPSGGGKSPKENVQKAAPADSLRKDVSSPVELKCAKKTAYDDFIGRLGDSALICTYNGKIFTADTLGKNKNFVNDLGSEFIIDKVFISKISKDDFFVNWQETNHEGVWTCVASFTRGKSKANWKHKFKTPEPGVPVMDSTYAWITARGMVGKIAIDEGQFVWKFDSLYDPAKFKFKEFDKPRVFPGTVLFHDHPIAGRKARRDTIIVNDVTGVRIR